MDALSGAYDHGPARMDMSDLNSNPSPLPAAGSEAQAHDDQHWSELLGQVGAEIAGPLTAAIERVTALAVTGKIDRHNLRALRDELDQARRAGMLGQQLARFASHRLRQNHERLQLTQMLRDVLLQRGRETQARGVQLKQVLQPVEVLADASLLFSLLNTVLDWALACARSHIEFRVELKSWPAHGRLSCRFVHRPLDELIRTSDFVSLHAANNAFLHWTAYNEIVGLLWRDKNFGPGIIIDDQDSRHGKSISITAPSRLSIRRTSPSCARAISFTIASPRPVPSARPVRSTTSGFR